MKTFIIILVFLAVTTSSYSQDTGKIKIEELDPSITSAFEQDSLSSTVAERIESEKKKPKKKNKNKKPKDKKGPKDYKKDVEWNMEKQTYEKIKDDGEIIEESLEDLLDEDIEANEFADDDMVE